MRVMLGDDLDERTPRLAVLAHHHNEAAVDLRPRLETQHLHPVMACGSGSHSGSHPLATRGFLLQAFALRAFTRGQDDAGGRGACVARIARHDW